MSEGRYTQHFRLYLQPHQLSQARSNSGIFNTQLRPDLSVFVFRSLLPSVTHRRKRRKTRDRRNTVAGGETLEGVTEHKNR